MLKKSLKSELNGLKSEFFFWTGIWIEVGITVWVGVTFWTLKFISELEFVKIWSEGSTTSYCVDHISDESPLRMENWLTYIFDFFIMRFVFFLYVSAICKSSLILMQCCHEHDYLYGYPVVLVQCTSFRYTQAGVSVCRHQVFWCRQEKTY